MSTPPPPAAGPHDGERRKSLGKYVKRMSSVFKREKPSRNLPQTASAAASAPSAPSAASASGEVGRQPEILQEEAATQDVAKAPSIRQGHPSEEPAAAPPTAAAAAAAAAATTDLTPTTSLQAPAPTPAPVASTPVLDRNALQQERARALFAKYGLSLESGELFKTGASAPLVPRVEKAIRMRVHRSCHKCGTLYGHDRICVQCKHSRCKKCPRYPKKKTTGDKEKEKEAVEEPKKIKVLTLTTRNGNELAYQPATQRIRRRCHKCDTFFVPPTATTCESCSHVRCTKCPREPAKRNKWPSGYPGDVPADSEDDVDDQEKQLDQFRRIWRKPRRIVRWECEQCHGLFRQGSPDCPGCGHERCDQCTRSPVKKPRHEEAFDPAIVAAVEAKLRALAVDSDPPTSEPEHV